MDNGYSICFNEWALDKEINGELGLLLIISSLSAEKGYCFASNNYLANLFNIREETISRKLNKLVKKGYITIEYDKKGCEVTNRYIRLTKLSTDDCVNNQPTIDENVKDNNTSINNTSINKKEIYKEKYFDNEKVNEMFIDFLKLRATIKAKNTDRAINTLINKLNKYDDDTKYKMIEKSIVNSWKDVYEIEEHKETRYERERRLLEEMAND